MHRKEKGELMSRIERRWRLGVVAGLVALLTAAIVAGAGQSAPSAQGGTIIAGTTDTVTNIDPAGAYDYGSFTLARVEVQMSRPPWPPGRLESKTISSPSLRTFGR